MIRHLLVCFLLLDACLQASAHFVFFVPDPSSGALRAVFSDTLKPDERVAIEKIENTKLFAIDAAGKETTPKWELDKAGGFAKIEVPGDGFRIVAGITDYGVLQRGDSKPFWLKYYPKTILGDAQSMEKAILGDRVPVEIVPILSGGQIRFQALAQGKPAAKVEISVIAPGEDKFQDLVTDEKGLSPAFPAEGQYGARFRFVESKSGEDKGKKYEELRHYATLVINLNKAK